MAVTGGFDEYIQDGEVTGGFDAYVPKRKPKAKAKTEPFTHRVADWFKVGLAGAGDITEQPSVPVLPSRRRVPTAGEFPPKPMQWPTQMTSFDEGPPITPETRLPKTPSAIGDIGGLARGFVKDVGQMVPWEAPLDILDEALRAGRRRAQQGQGPARAALGAVETAFKETAGFALPALAAPFNIAGDVLARLTPSLSGVTVLPTEAEVAKRMAVGGKVITGALENLPSWAAQAIGKTALKIAKDTPPPQWPEKFTDATFANTFTGTLQKTSPRAAKWVETTGWGQGIQDVVTLAGYAITGHALAKAGGRAIELKGAKEPTGPIRIPGAERLQPRGYLPGERLSEVPTVAQPIVGSQVEGWQPPWEAAAMAAAGRTVGQGATLPPGTTRTPAVNVPPTRGPLASEAEYKAAWEAFRKDAAAKGYTKKVVGGYAFSKPGNPRDVMDFRPVWDAVIAARRVNTEVASSELTPPTTPWYSPESETFIRPSKGPSEPTGPTAIADIIQEIVTARGPEGAHADEIIRTIQARIPGTNTGQVTAELMLAHLHGKIVQHEGNMFTLPGEKPPGTKGNAPKGQAAKEQRAVTMSRRIGDLDKLIAGLTEKQNAAKYELIELEAEYQKAASGEGGLTLDQQEGWIGKFKVVQDRVAELEGQLNPLRGERDGLAEILRRQDARDYMSAAQAEELSPLLGDVGAGNLNRYKIVVRNKRGGFTTLPKTHRGHDLDVLANVVSMTEDQFREWAQDVIGNRGQRVVQVSETGKKIGQPRQVGEIFDSLTDHELGILRDAIREMGKRTREEKVLPGEYAPESLAAEAESRIAEGGELPPEPPLPGGRIQKVGGPGTTEQTPVTKFETPGLQEKWELASKFEPTLGSIERIRQWGERVKHLFTRTYEHLPRDSEGFYEPLRFALTQLPAKKLWSGAEALRDVRAVVAPLKADPGALDLFKQAVVFEDLMTRVEAQEVLPFGLRPIDVQTEHARILRAVAESPKVMDALDFRARVAKGVVADYVQSLKDIGQDDLASRFNNPQYYRHLVLDYVTAGEYQPVRSGSGKRLGVGTVLGWIKRRSDAAYQEGAYLPSEHFISTRYVDAEFDVWAGMRFQAERNRVIAQAMRYDITAALKAEQQTLKEQGQSISLQRLALRRESPHGAGHYVPWQPRRGNMFFPADSLPEATLRRMLRPLVETTGKTIDDLMADFDEGTRTVEVSKGDLREIVAVGGQRLTLYLPEGVAKTLDTYQETLKPPTGAPEQFFDYLTRQWRNVALFAPHRFGGYRFRNSSSDMNAVMRMFPQAAKYIPRAARDMWRPYASKLPATNPDLIEFQKRAGPLATQQAREWGDVGALDDLQKMLTAEERRWRVLEWNPVRMYFDKIRLANDYAENLTRYAAFLNAMDEIRTSSTGMPRSLGVSKRAEIAALTDPYDRAYKVANEGIGAYDSVTAGTRALRWYVPFISWKEIEIGREYGLLRNMLETGRGGETLARRVTGLATLKTGEAATNWAIRATMAWGALHLWNHYVHPKEEESLSPDIRKRPHLIWGKGDDGRVMVSDRLLDSQDFLTWTGLIETPALWKDVHQGRMTIAQAAKEIAKAPIREAAGQFAPVAVSAYELMTGSSLYPDPFTPRTNQDRMKLLSQELAIAPEYGLAKGTITPESYLSSLRNPLARSIDVDQAAFYQLRDSARTFAQRRGKNVKYFSNSPVQPIWQGLNQGERGVWLGQLSQDERQKIAMAQRFHQKALREQAAKPLGR